MKKCITFLAIQKRQIKMTLRFHLTPVKMTFINNTNNNNCWWECGEKGILLHCWWESKLVQLIWKQYRCLSKTKIELSYYPAVTLLGIYPKECALRYDRSTCTPMFIASLFTIAKLWKQSRWPHLMNGWRKCGMYT
jgi:hypothetical protein